MPIALPNSVVRKDAPVEKIDAERWVRPKYNFTSLAQEEASPTLVQEEEVTEVRKSINEEPPG